VPDSHLQDFATTGALVNKHGLRLLVHLVNSLKYEQHLQVSDSTAEQGALAAKTILRAVAKSASVTELESCSPDRDVPPNWSEENTHLRYLVDWAFDNVSSDRPSVRGVCWDVIQRCAKHALGDESMKGSAKTWLQAQMSQLGPTAFHAKLYALSAAPSAADLAQMPADGVIEWLVRIETSLSNLDMTLRRKYLSIEGVFDGTDQPIFGHMKLFAGYIIARDWGNGQMETEDCEYEDDDISSDAKKRSAAEIIEAMLLKNLALLLDVCYQFLRNPDQCKSAIPASLWKDPSLTAMIAAVSASPERLGVYSMDLYDELGLKVKVSKILGVASLDVRSILGHFSLIAQVFATPTPHAP